MGYFRPFGFSRRTLAPLRGVTLIELLVSFSIVAIIGAVIFTSQGKFNKSFLLSNTAYDIALSMRDAEVYGIASRGMSGASNTGYGLEFSGAPSTHYLLFADSYPAVGASTCHPNTGAPDSKPGNCIYDSAQSEALTTYTLGNAMKISRFCGYTSAGVSYCSSGGANTITALDITFTRPDTSAIIYALNGASVSATNLAKACITVAAQSGDTRGVQVSLTGEVEFLNLNTPCP